MYEIYLFCCLIMAVLITACIFRFGFDFLRKKFLDDEYKSGEYPNITDNQIVVFFIFVIVISPVVILMFINKLLKRYK